MFDKFLKKMFINGINNLEKELESTEKKVCENEKYIRESRKKLREKAERFDINRNKLQ